MKIMLKIIDPVENSYRWLEVNYNFDQELDALVEMYEEEGFIVESEYQIKKED